MLIVVAASADRIIVLPAVLPTLEGQSGAADEGGVGTEPGQGLGHGRRSGTVVQRRRGWAWRHADHAAQAAVPGRDGQRPEAQGDDVEAEPRVGLDPLGAPEREPGGRGGGGRPRRPRPRAAPAAATGSRARAPPGRLRPSSRRRRETLPGGHLVAAHRLGHDHPAADGGHEGEHEQPLPHHVDRVLRGRPGSHSRPGARGRPRRARRRRPGAGRGPRPRPRCGRAPPAEGARAVAVLVVERRGGERLGAEVPAEEAVDVPGTSR